MEGESLSESLWYRKLVGKHAGLLRNALTENMSILIPQTCSLLSSNVTTKDIENHILLPNGDRGEFKTLSGYSVLMSGSQVVATGFPRQVVAKVLSSEIQIMSKTEGSGGATALVAISVYFYFISRPLLGGLPAPSRIDDMEHGLVRKYCAMLRSSPETEVVFARLQEAVDRASLDLRRRRRGDPIPLIHVHLEAACETAADALLTTTFFTDEPVTAKPALRRQLLQVLESLAMEPLHDQAYAAMLEAKAGEIAHLRSILDSIPDSSQDGFGIKKEFQGNFSPAVAMLGLLQSAVTPLEKLHCLRDASLTISRLVERNLELRGLDLDGFDFATDDTCDVLLHVIHSGYPEHRTHELPAQLEYMQLFHFAHEDMSFSPLGYHMSTFIQTLQYFENKKLEEIQSDMSSPLPSSPPFVDFAHPPSAVAPDCSSSVSPAVVTDASVDSQICAVSGDILASPGLPEQHLEARSLEFTEAITAVEG